MTSVMLRHPYIRYRRELASMSLYFRDRFTLGNKKNVCVDRGSPCVRVRVRSNNRAESRVKTQRYKESTAAAALEDATARLGAGRAGKQLHDAAELLQRALVAVGVENRYIMSWYV